jgi:hypothetical protein
MARTTQFWERMRVFVTKRPVNLVPIKHLSNGKTLPQEMSHGYGVPGKMPVFHDRGSGLRNGVLGSAKHLSIAQFGVQPALKPVRRDRAGFELLGVASASRFSQIIALPEYFQSDTRGLTRSCDIYPDRLSL